MLDRWIHKRAFLPLSIFFLLAILAFTPRYFSQIGRSIPSPIHFHGITMTLWLIMLISQALLIRWKAFIIHRWIGLTSYLLAPLVVIAILNLIHSQFAGATYLRPFYVYFHSLVIIGALAYIILYAFAIYYRKSPMTHARFMIATLFPLFTPVTDRLFSRYTPWIAQYMPTIENIPVFPFAGFLLADLILLVLILIDWKSKRSIFPFGVSLGVLLTYHISVFFLYQTEWWESFCYWFVKF